MSKTPRTNTIAPIGYARAQDLLLYREVWAGYSNKPADENGHPPVALYTQDQVNAMLTDERERADMAKAEGIKEGMRRAAEMCNAADKSTHPADLADAILAEADK